VDVIGLSILSGGQIPLLTSIMELLKENSMEDVLITVGGIIPREDRKVLKELGVSRVFGPGTLSNEIVRFMREEISEKKEKRNG
jgi:methylmalonyl-CoA mutase C-terminal domain/subunit